MKKIFFLLSLFFLLMACAESNDDVDNNSPSGPGHPIKPHDPFDRTVLVYISGENSLRSCIQTELEELREGSKGIDNGALVVYVDDGNSSQIPYIIWIRDGITVDSFSLGKDYLSSSPETMKRVLDFTSTYYPADEYGLVLWGHNTGWFIEDSIPATSAAAPRKAYGIDNGENTGSNVGKWMNLWTLTKTLWEWKHLKFIMADCCQFQCIETAYELRNVADYIIGSPAEVPGDGAPYETVVRGFFDTSDTFFDTIIDNYFAQVIWTTHSDNGWNTFTYESQTPLSVIKTAELRNLADATNTVLHAILPDDEVVWLNLSDKYLIYYCGNMNKVKEDVMYDMNDVIRYQAMVVNTDEAKAAYKTWKDVFDRTVIRRKCPEKGWMTDRQIQAYVFLSGILTDKRYGGVSMFIPQDRKGSRYLPYTYKEVNYNGYNADIKNTAWYQAARLSDFGW